MAVKLTIGMATYDDYDGVFFTLHSLRLYHADLAEHFQLLVVDNNPESKHGEAVKNLCKRMKCQYIPFTEWTGTTVKNKVFEHAETDYVLCMDCHVLLVPGALQYLLNYLNFQGHCRDLLHGPLLFDDYTVSATHMKLVWRGEMWGIWDKDQRGLDKNGTPFEIPAHGMGLFACRRDVWPGFNPKFRGFGGEEGYIHTKMRQRGDRVICLPGLRWVHRFGRPDGVKYTLRYQDKFRNYLLGFKELGLDPTEMIEHFKPKVSEKLRHEIINEVFGKDLTPQKTPEYTLL